MLEAVFPAPLVLPPVEPVEPVEPLVLLVEEVPPVDPVFPVEADPVLPVEAVEPVLPVEDVLPVAPVAAVLLPLAVPAEAALAICTGTTPPKGPARAGFWHLTIQTFCWPATSPVQVWSAAT